MLTFEVSNIASARSILNVTIENLKLLTEKQFEDRSLLNDQLKNLYYQNEKEFQSFSFFMNKLRLSLTNEKVGAPVAQIMQLLGKRRSIEYLNNALNYVTFNVK